VWLLSTVDRFLPISIVLNVDRYNTYLTYSRLGSKVADPSIGRQNTAGLFLSMSKIHFFTSMNFCGGIYMSSPMPWMRNQTLAS